MSKIFITEEGNVLCNCITICSNINYALPYKQIRKLALDYIKYQIDLRDKIGKIRKWQQGFVEEFNGNNNLSLRKPQNTEMHCCMWFIKQNAI
jgi:hypothetical protein